MTRISHPIFVMVLAAGLIFVAALLLSTMIGSADRPIKTNAPTAALASPTTTA
jgi:hypothetical protein